MKRKKIIIITSHPANYMDTLFNAIAEKYDLEVFYNNKHSTEKKWKHDKFFKGYFLKECSMFFVLKKLLLVDFIIIGGWNYIWNLVFIIFLILSGKRFGVWSDVPDVSRITFFKKNIKKIFFNFVPYFLLTGPSGIEHYKKYYSIPDNKIKVFPYSTSFKIDFSSKRVQSNVRLREKEIINIFIANRFIRRKGYETIYKTLKILREKKLLNKFSIIIAGDGECFKEYVDKISPLSNKIKFLGWIEPDEYEKNLKNSDIFIHASDFEPYGIPVIDALLLNKIVIASERVMSAVDYIKDGVNGFLFPPGDYNRLSEILLKIAREFPFIFKMEFDISNQKENFPPAVNLKSLKDIMER